MMIHKTLTLPYNLQFLTSRNIPGLSQVYLSHLIPNHSADPKVLEQLLFSGILEAVQIRQKGFASRASFDDFIKRPPRCVFSWSDLIRVYHNT